MRLDPSTRAEYDALGPAGDRAALVVAALGSSVTATVYDGEESVRASGSMQAPWASASGARIVVGELDSFLVTDGGMPDADWVLRFEGNGRWVEGSFGLSASGAEFRWSLATFTTGQLGTIGTAEITARGLEPVQQDFAVSWNVLRSVEASFSIGWDLLSVAPLTFSVPESIRLYRGSAYSLAQHASGGVPPYTFDHTGYALPSGVTMTAAGLLEASVSAGIGISPGIVFGVTDSALGSVTADFSVSWNVEATAAGLDSMLGALVHDGPATPEQISLYMTVDGSLDASTTIKATTRYRPVGGSWVQAHPMFHIRNGTNIRAGRIPAFANVITGLTPGQSYEVEVTVIDGAQSVVKTLTCTTRSLPAAAGAPTITIPAGSTPSQVQTLLNSAVPGSVVQFENGTYDFSGHVNEMLLNRSGTEEQPIYVRGESRDGVIIKCTTKTRVMHLMGASYLIVENLTVEGDFTDGGVTWWSNGGGAGIEAHDGYAHQNVTVRNCTVRGVDAGIVFMRASAFGILVYDNLVQGNNAYTQANLESNVTWNDDGIKIPSGSCAFNNTVSGFGDSLCMNHSSAGSNVAVHFYRNRVLWGGDDGAELDYGNRNITMYDNQIANTNTLFSCDPIYSGPCFIFRNTWINVGRQSFKLNNWNLGVLIYSNTIVRRRGKLDTHAAGMHLTSYSPDGPQSDWALRNNLILFQDPLATEYAVQMQAGGHDRTDITNNGWYPDGRFVWPGYGSSTGTGLANLLTKTDSKGPLFGTQTRRHENDIIVEANPFATAVTLPDPYYSEIADGSQDVTLSAASVARNAGIHIPGITDGHSGAAPDIGAVISGRTPPVVGDRS